jgi:hypothetical protein
MAIQEPYKEHARERPVTLTPTEARQGVLGRPVLYVLLIGLLLAMLAWGAAEFWGMSIDTQTPADGTQTSAPAANPASENENVVNDDPVPGEVRQTEPVIVNPQPTGNQ